MSNPLVVDKHAEASSVNGTSTTFSLGFTTEPGDLIIGLCVPTTIFTGSPAWTVTDNGAASDWPIILEGTNSTVCLVKKLITPADGTTVSTMTFVSGGATRKIAAFYKITGHTEGSNPTVLGGSTTGTGTTPDPGSVNASTSGLDNLFLALCGKAATNSGPPTVTSEPANYSELYPYSYNGPRDAWLGIAQRDLTADSDNPGTFTISKTMPWWAGTLCIQGISGAGPILSNPTAEAISAFVASGTVDTTGDDGTLYWYISQSVTPPTVANLKAGTGAISFGNQTVTGTGTQTVPSMTGLTEDSDYFVHYLHTDENGDSNIATSPEFTTPLAPGANDTLIVFTNSFTYSNIAEHAAVIEALLSLSNTFNYVSIEEQAAIIDALTAYTNNFNYEPIESIAAGADGLLSILNNFSYESIVEQAAELDSLIAIANTFAYNNIHDISARADELIAFVNTFTQLPIAEHDSIIEVLIKFTNIFSYLPAIEHDSIIEAILPITANFNYGNIYDELDVIDNLISMVVSINIQDINSLQTVVELLTGYSISFDIVNINEIIHIIDAFNAITNTFVYQDLNDAGGATDDLIAITHNYTYNVIQTALAIEEELIALAISPISYNDIYSTQSIGDELIAMQINQAIEAINELQSINMVLAPMTYSQVLQALNEVGSGPVVPPTGSAIINAMIRDMIQ